MTPTPATAARRKRAAAAPAAAVPDGYATADECAAGDLDVDGEDLVLPSGKRVRLRGLSRHELMFAGKGTDDNALIERRNVVACLVVPKMTMAQVEQWQRNSAAGGDFKALSEAIRDRSGIAAGADKSAVRGDGSGSESGV
jgi:hypothetical protein